MTQARRPPCRDRLLQALNLAPALDAVTLSRMLMITCPTVRRELSDLAAEGLVVRSAQRMRSAGHRQCGAPRVGWTRCLRERQPVKHSSAASVPRARQEE